MNWESIQLAKNIIMQGMNEWPVYYSIVQSSPLYLGYWTDIAISIYLAAKKHV